MSKNPANTPEPKKFHLGYEIIGWYGTVAIITAYGLNSFNIIGAGSLWYQLLNATGAVGIVVISLSKKAYQPAALNAVWTIIAVIALAQILFFSR